jgi:hypothetical protein
MGIRNGNFNPLDAIGLLGEYIIASEKYSAGLF